MRRIISFLVLIALAAAGAAWVADQSGDVVLSSGGWRVATSLPVFVLALGVVIVAAMLAWSMLRGLWRMPKRLRHRRREKRLARGRHAITHGLLAIGHGDSDAARRHSDVARRLTSNDPLALLLHAQSAQLDGDRGGAQRAFRAMAEREDTRLLGLRGLFIEAQRSDDAFAAVTIAEEALKLAPGATWASQALLGFRCSQGDWTGALAILDNNLTSGLIDRATFRRQRGVLLTARALEVETSDRDLSRDSAMEAVKLAPILVPAAVLAAKFQSEAHQIRRAIKIIETAWLAQPHPDLADAYAHVKLGDSAKARLVRVETLAAKVPGNIEGALAVARAAIDAAEFSRARDVLAPFTEASTQRVAMLMAEIERTENGDSGRARAWTLRAVRARHDPVWTADGYVSDRWRPVSPVTGRIDAFQWQTPLAALPSDASLSTIESEIVRETLLAPPRPMLRPASPVEAVAADRPSASLSEPEPPVPEPEAIEPEPAEAPATAAAAGPVAAPPPQPAAPPPLFRDRPELARSARPVSTVPAVIPILRAPDDPGVDDEEPLRDEFAELNAGQQTGGWRGFIGRLGG
ncbi:heme biosynthesis HemY N-terminal domain-containing protein [Tardiphaga sp.]|uniref:heme biosynthesis protein HemY n=1 Tax=Tardiphaga sp. TaxID=1926292 RepID=UPI0025F4F7CE|nr:heme biosynthesis HemY N-terminal domain-containing protein [Tardiphaga sp.]